MSPQRSPILSIFLKEFLLSNATLNPRLKKLGTSLTPPRPNHHVFGRLPTSNSSASLTQIPHPSGVSTWRPRQGTDMSKRRLKRSKPNFAGWSRNLTKVFKFTPKSPNKKQRVVSFVIFLLSGAQWLRLVGVYYVWTLKQFSKGSVNQVVWLIEF